MVARRAILATRAGRIVAGLETARGIPLSVRKVRAALKKDRPFVAVREAVRTAGRFQFGPVWLAGEALLGGLGRLFRRRRRRAKK